MCRYCWQGKDVKPQKCTNVFGCETENGYVIWECQRMAKRGSDICGRCKKLCRRMRDSIPPPEGIKVTNY